MLEKGSFQFQRCSVDVCITTKVKVGNANIQEDRDSWGAEYVKFSWIWPKPWKFIPILKQSQKQYFGVLSPEIVCFGEQVLVLPIVGHLMEMPLDPSGPEPYLNSPLPYCFMVNVHNVIAMKIQTMMYQDVVKKMVYKKCDFA